MVRHKYGAFYFENYTVFSFLRAESCVVFWHQDKTEAVLWFRELSCDGPDTQHKHIQWKSRERLQLSHDFSL